MRRVVTLRLSSAQCFQTAIVFMSLVEYRVEKKVYIPRCNLCKNVYSKISIVCIATPFKNSKSSRILNYSCRGAEDIFMIVKSWE